MRPKLDPDLPRSAVIALKRMLDDSESFSSIVHEWWQAPENSIQRRTHADAMAQACESYPDAATAVLSALSRGDDIDRRIAGAQLESSIESWLHTGMSTALWIELAGVARRCFEQIPTTVAENLVAGYYRAYKSEVPRHELAMLHRKGGAALPKRHREVLRSFLLRCPSRPNVAAAWWLLFRRQVTRTGPLRRGRRTWNTLQQQLHAVLANPPEFITQPDRYDLTDWLKRAFWSGRPPVPSRVTSRGAAGIVAMRNELGIDAETVMRFVRHRAAVKVLVSALEAGDLEPNDPVRSRELRERLLEKLPAERMQDAIGGWTHDLPLGKLVRAILRATGGKGSPSELWRYLMAVRNLSLPREDAMAASLEIEMSSPAPAPRLVVIGHVCSIAPLAEIYPVIAPEVFRRLLPWLALARAETDRYILAYCRVGDARPLVPLAEALLAYFGDDESVIGFDLPVESAPELLNLAAVPRYKILSEISVQLLAPGMRLASQLQEAGTPAPASPDRTSRRSERRQHGRAKP